MYVLHLKIYFQLMGISLNVFITANLKQRELFSRYGFGKSLVQYFHKKKLKTLKIYLYF